jgi:hypothetical protein
VPRLLGLLLVAAALAGCGDDETVSAPSPTPEATAVATETPTPTPTTTETPAPTATEQPAPEEQEGGAGDEEAARVPARFTVGPDGIDPPQVSVPAFLAIELIVDNKLDRPVIVRLEGAEPITAGPGEVARARLDGRRRGRYVVNFLSVGQALLVTGAEPGP